MMKLLNKKESQLCTKEDLIDLEFEMIFLFSCDFTYHNPVHFIDRYLRLLNFNNEVVINMMCIEICKFSLNDEMFLNYKPSQIAACCCLLAINIFKKDELDYNKKMGNDITWYNFIKCAKENPAKFYINTFIWNKDVEKASGYTLASLLTPLYNLAQFIE